MDFLPFFAGVLTLALFYVALTIILNLEAGIAGLWDLGTAGLVAVGAYTYVLVTVDPERAPIGLGLPWFVGLIAAAGVTGLVALLISLLSIRARGEYFLIVTLAFAEVIHQLTINVRGVTRGTRGISQLDRPLEQFVAPGNYQYVLLGISVIAVALLAFVVRRIALSPFGRSTRAIRDNESVAMSVGKPATQVRRQIFVLAGCLIGGVAPLYLWHLRSITPSLFTTDLTFTVWTALVIGGIASLRGPIVGGLLLIIATEGMTLLQGSAEFAVTLSFLQPILLGLMLIIIMRFRPEGIITERVDLHRHAVRSSTRAMHLPEPLAKSPSAVALDGEKVAK